MSTDEDALTQLLNLNDLSGVSVDKLVEAAKQARESRLQLQEFTGRVIAEMHRGGLTFVQIAKLIDVPDSTAHRWARPYL